MRRRTTGRATPRLFAAVLAAVLALGAVAFSAPSTGAQAGPSITDEVVPSFDGTPIVATLFVPPGASEDAPVPLILRTHGWGGTGQKDAGGFVGDLIENGYAVLTWDQRGFGCSGGEVAIDKPDVEGRDVGALIDWAVATAPIETDGAGDPLVGMTGGSYAGGIQTATVAVDDRVDVIVPEVSWSDLRYSLYAGEVVNQGWAALLYAAGLATATGLGMNPECPTYPQPGGLDTTITQGFVEGATTGSISGPVLEFFAASSLAGYGDQRPVAVPTLVVQGSTDTLFDLTDGHRIVEHVRANGAPAKFVVFCGGHVSCPESYRPAEDEEHVDRLILAWLARYLRGEDSVDVGPAVEYLTNDGVWRRADAFPPSVSSPVRASGTGSLVSVPVVALPDVAELAGMISDYEGGIPALPLNSAQITPAGHPGAITFEVATAGEGPLELLGKPEVELDVTGIGTEIILMAKLIHREAGHVVNLQEGAVRVPLAGGPVTVDVPMPGVAYTIPPGHHLDLQVSTVSLMHSNARLPVQAQVTARVAVPATGAVAPAAPGGPVTAGPAGDGDDGAGDGGRPGGEGSTAGVGSRLPVTGGDAALLLGVGLLAALLAMTSRRLARR